MNIGARSIRKGHMREVLFAVVLCVGVANSAHALKFDFVNQTKTITQDSISITDKRRHRDSRSLPRGVLRRRQPDFTARFDGFRESPPGFRDGNLRARKSGLGAHHG